MEYVRIATLERHTDYMLKDDIFQFRSDAGFKTIQKLCFYLLRKIGAYAGHTVTNFTVKKDDVINLVYTQRLDAIEQGITNFKIYMGPEDFNELSRSSACRYYMQFSIESRNSRGFLGMKVEVLPWMDGVLVVPDDH